MPHIDSNFEDEVAIEPNYDGVIMLSQEVVFFDDAETRPDGRKIFHIFERVNTPDGEGSETDSADSLTEDLDSRKADLFSRALESSISNIEGVLKENGIYFNEWCPPLTTVLKSRCPEESSTKESLELQETSTEDLMSQKNLRKLIKKEKKNESNRSSSSDIDKNTIGDATENEKLKTKRQSLKGGKLRKQDKSKPFRCPACPNSYEYLGSFNRHLFTAHNVKPKFERQAKPGMYSCPKCYFTTKYSTSALRHSRDGKCINGGKRKGSTCKGGVNVSHKKDKDMRKWVANSEASSEDVDKTRKINDAKETSSSDTRSSSNVCSDTEKRELTQAGCDDKSSNMKVNNVKKNKNKNNLGNERKSSSNSNSSEEDKPYKCIQCDFKTRYVQNAERHLRRVHSIIYKYKKEKKVKTKSLTSKISNIQSKLKMSPKKRRLSNRIKCLKRTSPVKITPAMREKLKAKSIKQRKNKQKPSKTDKSVATVTKPQAQCQKRTSPVKITPAMREKLKSKSSNQRKNKQKPSKTDISVATKAKPQALKEKTSEKLNENAKQMDSKEDVCHTEKIVSAESVTTKETNAKDNASVDGDSQEMIDSVSNLVINNDKPAEEDSLKIHTTEITQAEEIVKSGESNLAKDIFGSDQTGESLQEIDELATESHLLKENVNEVNHSVPEFTTEEYELSRNGDNTADFKKNDIISSSENIHPTERRKCIGKEELNKMSSLTDFMQLIQEKDKVPESESDSSEGKTARESEDLKETKSSKEEVSIKTINVRKRKVTEEYSEMEDNISLQDSNKKHKLEETVTESESQNTTGMIDQPPKDKPILEKPLKEHCMKPILQIVLTRLEDDKSLMALLGKSSIDTHSLRIINYSNHSVIMKDLTTRPKGPVNTATAKNKERIVSGNNSIKITSEAHDTPLTPQCSTSRDLPINTTNSTRPTLKNVAVKSKLNRIKAIDPLTLGDSHNDPLEQNSPRNVSRQNSPQNDSVGELEHKADASTNKLRVRNQPDDTEEPQLSSKHTYASDDDDEIELLDDVDPLMELDPFMDTESLDKSTLAPETKSTNTSKHSSRRNSKDYKDVDPLMELDPFMDTEPIDKSTNTSKHSSRRNSKDYEDVDPLMELNPFMDTESLGKSTLAPETKSSNTSKHSSRHNSSKDYIERFKDDYLLDLNCSMEFDPLEDSNSSVESNASSDFVPSEDSDSSEDFHISTSKKIAKTTPTKKFYSWQALQNKNISSDSSKQKEISSKIPKQEVISSETPKQGVISSETPEQKDISAEPPKQKDLSSESQNKQDSSQQDPSNVSSAPFGSNSLDISDSLMDPDDALKLLYPVVTLNLMEASNPRENCVSEEPNPSVEDDRTDSPDSSLNLDFSDESDLSLDFEPSKNTNTSLDMDPLQKSNTPPEIDPSQKSNPFSDFDMSDDSDSICELDPLEDWSPTLEPKTSKKRKDPLGCNPSIEFDPLEDWNPMLKLKTSKISEKDPLGCNPSLKHNPSGKSNPTAEDDPLGCNLSLHLHTSAKSNPSLDKDPLEGSNLSEKSNPTPRKSKLTFQSDHLESNPSLKLNFLGKRKSTSNISNPFLEKDPLGDSDSVCEIDLEKSYSKSNFKDPLEDSNPSMDFDPLETSNSNSIKSPLLDKDPLEDSSLELDHLENSKRSKDSSHLEKGPLNDANLSQELDRLEDSNPADDDSNSSLDLDPLEISKPSKNCSFSEKEPLNDGNPSEELDRLQKSASSLKKHFLEDCNNPLVDLDPLGNSKPYKNCSPLSDANPSPVLVHLEESNTSSEKDFLDSNPFVELNPSDESNLPKDSDLTERDPLDFSDISFKRHTVKKLNPSFKINPIKSFKSSVGLDILKLNPVVVLDPLECSNSSIESLKVGKPTLKIDPLVESSPSIKPSPPSKLDPLGGSCSPTVFDPLESKLSSGFESSNNRPPTRPNSSLDMDSFKKFNPVVVLDLLESCNSLLKHDHPVKDPLKESSPLIEVKSLIPPSGSSNSLQNHLPTKKSLPKNGKLLKKGNQLRKVSAKGKDMNQLRKLSKKGKDATQRRKVSLGLRRKQCRKKIKCCNGGSGIPQRERLLKRKARLNMRFPIIEVIDDEVKDNDDDDIVIVFESMHDSAPQPVTNALKNRKRSAFKRKIIERNERIGIKKKLCDGKKENIGTTEENKPKVSNKKKNTTMDAQEKNQPTDTPKKNTLTEVLQRNIAYRTKKAKDCNIKQKDIKFKAMNGPVVQLKRYSLPNTLKKKITSDVSLSNSLKKKIKSDSSLTNTVKKKIMSDLRKNHLPKSLKKKNTSDLRKNSLNNNLKKKIRSDASLSNSLKKKITSDSSSTNTHKKKITSDLRKNSPNINLKKKIRSDASPTNTLKKKITSDLRKNSLPKNLKKNITSDPSLTNTLKKKITSDLRKNSLNNNLKRKIRSDASLSNSLKKKITSDSSPTNTLKKKFTSDLKKNSLPKTIKKKITSDASPSNTLKKKIKSDLKKNSLPKTLKKKIRSDPSLTNTLKKKISSDLRKNFLPKTLKKKITSDALKKSKTSPKCLPKDSNCKRKTQFKKTSLTVAPRKKVPTTSHQKKPPSAALQTNASEDSKNDQLKNLVTQCFRCSKCDYLTTSKRELNLHCYSHSEIQAFRCSLCPYSCNSRVLLNQHSKIHLDTKKFNCDICSYATNFRGNLKIHESTHTNTRKIQCSKCNFSTNFRRQFLLHKVSHLKSTNMKCFECDFWTNSKTVLRKHLMEHSKVSRSQNTPPKYRCLQCMVTCKSLYVYKQHRKRHVLPQSSKKVFQCALCRFGTNTKSLFIRHLSNNHNDPV